MDKRKRDALTSTGWRVGEVDEFLGLTEVESRLIALKLALSDQIRQRRRSKRLTQARFAKYLRSSQSRVAKIEAGDPSVSLDLLMRALLVIGGDPRSV
ncbi:MAG: helix-turn-helix domain-containing protein [Gemmatimonadales bacterium]